MDTRKKILSDLLSRATMSDKWIEIFINDEIWDRVFTHASVSKINYELLEFQGDKVLNSIASDFVEESFGDQINTPVWRTKIHHYIVGKKTLGSIGKKLGIDKLMIIDPKFFDEQKKVLKIHPTVDFTNHKVYLSVVEDIFEAIFGAFLSIGKKHKFSTGAMYEVCSRIVKSLYRMTPMDIDYDKLWDPKTRIKELYQSITKWYKHYHPGSEEPIKTKFVEKRVVDEGGYSKFIFKIYGWPIHRLDCKDCKAGARVPEHATLLAMKEGFDADEVEQETYKEALKNLKNRYEKEIPPPPKKI